jgi:hypothetical protein
LETAALILDLDTSHDEFNRVCKHTPNLFQVPTTAQGWEALEI